MDSYRRGTGASDSPVDVDEKVGFRKLGSSPSSDPACHRVHRPRRLDLDDTTHN